jgi:hypothetical protein
VIFLLDELRKAIVRWRESKAGSNAKSTGGER